MNKLTNEAIGLSINNAAGYLPQGYKIKLCIEHFGYGFELYAPSGELINNQTKADSLPDEIDELIEVAKLHNYKALYGLQETRKMGMYTEIYVNADLKKDTPQEVIDILSAMCKKDGEAGCLSDKPRRWAYLFNNGSYYMPLTECAKLTHNDIAECYSLLAKGDIKNYCGEIEEFFDFIMPWCDGEFIGYYRYEESREPTLVYTDV